MENMLDTLALLPRGLAYMVLGLAILVIAKMVRDLVTRYSIEKEIASAGNAAVSLRLCGYLGGVILVFVGSVWQPWSSGGPAPMTLRATGEELLWVLLYAAVGILILNCVRPISNLLVMYKFNVDDQVVKNKNVAVATAEAGMTIAVGLVIAGSIAGAGGPLLAAPVFLCLGLGVLLLFALFYEWTTSFNVHEHLEQGNVAVGVTMGGNMVAIGLVVFKATFGSFAGWAESMMTFGLYAVLGFALLYLLRWCADFGMMHSTKIAAQVREGNIAIAYVESAVVVFAAVTLLFTV